PTVDRSKPGHTGLLSRESNRGPGQHAIILTALTILWCAMPAVAACLRRVRRVDFLDPSGSFVLQTAYQATPSVGEDRPVETSFRSASVRQVDIWAFGVGFGFGTPGELNDSQVFDTDDVESPGKLGAGLLHPVLAPVPCPSEQLRDRRLHLAASGGAAATASEASLQAFESDRRSSCLGKLPTLLSKGRCRAPVPSPHRPLFERQVPDVPGMPALLEQVAPLHRRGVHAEPRHAIDPIIRNRQFRMSEWRTCGSSRV
ncbi:hypothetical protein EV651_127110, partial [Kribbella sp. VKM Ac-2571]